MASIVFSSCTENIDDSDLYTFTGEMMIDHMKNNPEKFSSFATLLSRVKSSEKKANASSMEALLSARGNYTCFAPNNEAIKMYLDTLLVYGVITDTALMALPDSVARVIVFNSLIDNGNADAYASTDFGAGALSITNMNDRYVDISFGNEADGTTVIYVNSSSKILEKDIEVENGYIHEIDHVLSPSSATIADLIISTDNTSFFGTLIGMTGIDDNLTAYKDESYEDDEDAGELGPYNSGGSGWPGYYPEKRFFGFTAFVETDSIFKLRLGLGENATEGEMITALKDYVQTNADYKDDTSWGTDYTSEKNWLYQFVAYHFLPERLIWNKLVIFSNENGFNNQSPNDGTKFQTNVWEYYETLDPNRRSIKITGIRGGKRINRVSVYNVNQYKEKPDETAAANEFLSLDITINSDNGDYKNQALNGYYYPIEDILLWTEKIPGTVLNERMRYDVTSLLPELMTNNHRRTGDATHRAWYYTSGYFDKENGGSGSMLNVSKETDLCYLTNTQNDGGSGNWINYQADEFNIKGQYDFVMKLPPVPYTGTYEIRYGVNANSNRGMAQIYVGTNPNNLPAVGIPIDLRLYGTDPSIGWVSDSGLTDEEIEELDKQLRNNDYMKGPKYFASASGASGRVTSNCLRKIIYRGQLEEGKTYYIRYKSVLEGTSYQFFYDYLEFVPKTVYNGDEPEDKW